MATTWQQKWRTQPSSAAIQVGKMEPTQQSLPQQHRGFTELLASQTMHTHHFTFLCTHHSLCIHTTWMHIHTVHILMHTPNHLSTHTLCTHTHMQIHHSICTHIPLHYLDLSVPTESLTVISCAMRPAACRRLLLLNDSIFLIFVPWS